MSTKTFESAPKSHSGFSQEAEQNNNTNHAYRDHIDDPGLAAEIQQLSGPTTPDLSNVYNINDYREQPGTEVLGPSSEQIRRNKLEQEYLRLYNAFANPSNAFYAAGGGNSTQTAMPVTPHAQEEVLVAAERMQDILAELNPSPVTPEPIRPTPSVKRTFDLTPDERSDLRMARAARQRDKENRERAEAYYSNPKNQSY